MYKNKVLFFALFCTVTQYASDVTSWLEIKPSYFFSISSPMKNIYNHGGFEIQGSASVPVYRSLDLYGSVGYRRLCGHALGSGDKTTLSVIPIDFGIKPVYHFGENFYSFIAFGPRYFSFNQNNSSPYISDVISGNGIGLFFNIGCNVKFKEHCLFGIFGEYSYENTVICPTMVNVYSSGSVQLGGLAFGVSLGYAF